MIHPHSYSYEVFELERIEDVLKDEIAEVQEELNLLESKKLEIEKLISSFNESGVHEQKANDEQMKKYSALKEYFEERSDNYRTPSI